MEICQTLGEQRFLGEKKLSGCSGSSFIMNFFFVVCLLLWALLSLSALVGDFPLLCISPDFEGLVNLLLRGDKLNRGKKYAYALRFRTSVT